MDVYRLRKDFPLLAGSEDSEKPIYLDSASQTLRPRSVMEAMDEYYESFPACAGRSAHKLATEISIRCDEVRSKAANFLGAEDSSEISFLKNATEGLNTIIFGCGLERGDEVVTTDYEHNSVHVPLLRASETIGIRRRIVDSLPDGTFDLESFEEVMSRRVKLVAACLTSNVTGYTLPAKEVVDIAHSHGAAVVFDAAQTAPSRRVDARELDADFVVACAHKMLGPSGVGIMYARRELSERLDPRMLGGHGVAYVDRDSYELLPPPERFEAGLQNYAGIVGTGAAIDYLNAVGLEEVFGHELSLNRRLTRALRSIPGVDILEPADPNLRGGMLGFNLAGFIPHDVAVILDHSRGIMLRAGRLCCHSIFEARGIEGCARASFYLYNTTEEVEALAEAVEDMTAGL
ncbi:MAG: cysteine desulfurase [Methanobacteriota archaeon]|nr:MAG: cysteine desulfurase [Euryarchaeota archaeon]